MLMPIFSDPNTAVIALVIGLLGLLVEFHAPGSILPGVIGAALVLLSASALARYPLSPGAVSLIAVAILLLALELKISSHGLLAVCGAVLFACGLYLLIDSPDPDRHITIGTAAGVVLPVALITAFLLTIAARARQNKTLAGPTRLLGRTGVVVDAPGLRVRIEGEYWNAVSSQQLAAGTSVRVDAVSGLKLSVSPAYDSMGTA